jgi:Protein of unknown function (DUF1344)
VYNPFILRCSTYFYLMRGQSQPGGKQAADTTDPERLAESRPNSKSAASMETIMKNHSKLLSAILAGSLAFGTVGAAMADSHNGTQSTFSSVRSVVGGVLTLADGTQYTLPYGFDASKLQSGERVAIMWTRVDNSAVRSASTISVI